jgi:hypothetical protein
MKVRLSAAIVLFSVLAIPLYADEWLNRPEAPVKITAEAELGVVKVLYHTYQAGSSGTSFDLVNQGGQEILFPFQRYTAHIDILKNQRVSLLYQPLTVDTQVRTRDVVVIDGQTFPAGSDLQISYGFPFWRATWAWQFQLGSVKLGTGLALQLRNASITWTVPDGSVVSVSQNLGPVPALHISADWRINRDFSLYAEATGLWASSAIINGSNFEFEGSLLDASIRPSVHLRDGVTIFLNARFLGGTARGTSQYASTQWSTNVERYTENILATMSLTLGAQLR